MSLHNRAVLDRINEEALRRGNADILDELVADDFVEHDPLPGMPGDREGFKGLVRALHHAFSDIEYTIDDQIAAGDKVIERWTWTGTHSGDWLGIPATGRRITFAGIDISRLKDRRMAEHWTQVDVLSMLQQMGVIPEQAGAPA